MPDKRLTVNPYEDMFTPSKEPAQAPGKLPAPAAPAQRSRRRGASPRNKARRSSGQSESQVNNLRNRSTGDWEKFEHLNTRVRGDQISYLDQLARQMNRSRAKGVEKERITKNTLIRAAIEALASLKFDYENILTEDQLIKRVIAAAGRKRV